MKIRFSLLRVIKIAAGLCFPFPALPLYAGLSLFCKPEADAAFLVVPLFCFMASAGAGMAAGALLIPWLDNRPGRLFSFLSNLAGFFVGLLCGGGVFWLVSTVFAGAGSRVWSGLFLGGAAALLSFICVILGRVIWSWDYPDVISGRYFLVLVIFDAICSLLFWAMKLPLDPAPFCVCFLLAACVYAASKNQGNLDYLMVRRNHNSGAMPKGMRWYSFSLVGVIFILIFAGYFLRKPIAAFFTWILYSLKNFAAWLFNLIPRGEISGDIPADEGLPSVGGAEDMGLPPAEGGPSPLWNILGILLIALMLWLAWYYRRGIASAFKKLWERIRGFFSHLLFHRGRPSALADENRYFEDMVEEVSRDPSSFWKKEKPYDQKRWKKEYRAFSAMKPGEGKLRKGYRLAMQYLLLQNIPLSPADTPEEIQEKAGNRLPKDLFACVTQSYCQTRYGGLPAESKDIHDIEALLSTAQRINN